MEIKVKIYHRGDQLHYLIHPLSRHIYQARLLNSEKEKKCSSGNVLIYLRGLNWQSDCDDPVLVLELSTAIKTILN